jgi:hypothetical protein
VVIVVRLRLDRSPLEAERMLAADFEVLFGRYVAAPARAVGFEFWGKDLWYESEGVRAALLRTELRHTWPFQLTFVLGHSCLRSFDDELPAPPSRNASEYPVKAAPAELKTLAKRFRYHPSNLGHHPQQTMREGRVDRQLDQVGQALVHWFPIAAQRITPTVLRDQIARYGEAAWCEKRWVEDYDRHLAGSRER